jgi:hypothetical protein
MRRGTTRASRATAPAGVTKSGLISSSSTSRHVAPRPPTRSLRQSSPTSGSTWPRSCFGYDSKRLYAFHSLHRSTDGVLVAAAEKMYLHVDTSAGRAGRRIELLT